MIWIIAPFLGSAKGIVKRALSECHTPIISWNTNISNPGPMAAKKPRKKGPNLSVGRGEKLSVKRGGGLTAKGRKKYNRATGSNLKAPVTGKVKPGSKAAKRRKSFCARSRSWTGERGKAARRRWKC